MTMDSRGLEVNPDHQIRDLEWHQDLSAEKKIGVSIFESLVILQMNHFYKGY